MTARIITKGRDPWTVPPRMIERQIGRYVLRSDPFLVARAIGTRKALRYD